jgi:hypothetical protein
VREHAARVAHRVLTTGGGEVRKIALHIRDFSRSEGAGSATTRKVRGLTRSVMDRMVPPLPAASRPSKTTMIRSPLALTQSCNEQELGLQLAQLLLVFFALELG